MIKNLPDNTGDVRDTDSISGSGRSPKGGNGNPLQYSEKSHGQSNLARGITRTETHPGQAP